MHVFKLKSQIDQDGHLRLNVPTNQPKNSMMEVTIKLKPLNGNKKQRVGKKYNFSDIAKMNWQGNTVAEQRKLRNEW